MHKTISIPLTITKVDEEQRRVWGVATSEALDSQGDVLDYDASKKAVGDWLKIGNIREMHDRSKAVGKAFDAQFDDAKKEITVGAYISRSADGENTWQKVKEGILTGFSVGGKILEEKLDKLADQTVNRVTDWAMSELSLVDNPANPTAQIVMVKSADGQAIDYIDAQAVQDFLKAVDASLAKRFPAKTEASLPMPWWIEKFYDAGHTQEELRKFNLEAAARLEKRDYSDKQRAAMADAGQALPDGSFPIKDKTDLANAVKAYGRSKNKAKAKAHIIKRARALKATDLLPADWKIKSKQSDMTKRDTLKGFMGTARVVDIACQLTWFLESELSEGDEETAAAVSDALAALKRAAVSEINELDEVYVVEMVDIIEAGLSAVDLAKHKEKDMDKVATGKQDENAVEKIQTPNGETITQAPRVDNTKPSEEPKDKQKPEEGDADGQVDTVAQGEAAPPAQTPSNPAISAAPPANDAGAGTAEVAAAEPAAPASPQAQPKSATVTPSASAGGQPDAPTEDDDKDKSQVAGFTKALTSLEKRLDGHNDLQKAVSELSTLVKGSLEDFGKRLTTLEKQPQPIKTKASYTEIEKGKEAEVKQSSRATQSDDEITELVKRADYLAANPGAGTAEERGDVFRKLWRVDTSKFRRDSN